MFKVLETDMTELNIAVKNTEEIYQQFGYSSINENTISKDFEEYILGCVKNYPLEEKVKIVIHIRKKDEKELDSLDDHIHKHFCNKLADIELSLKQQFKEWKINMTIGILFLVLCLVLVQVLEAFQHINFMKIIKEGLIIIGWVALWEPVTFILFSWRNLRRDRLYYKKLCSIPISVVEY
ncbi:hypothetical protein HMPREF1982_01273 [Clostridiales bacterium oral taxon 876 str. F0540]|nr:hypothetical protein HMPREF1982_01273 [Clostridiales bacterium oral taxon 876 str. F0540]